MNDRPTDWDEGMRRVRLFPFDEKGPLVSAGAPEPDGSIMVGWDQNSVFPAYHAPDGAGGFELAPFTPMAQFAPEGFVGDFFVDGFTDAAIKARWREARKGEATRARILAAVQNLQIPHEFRGTGLLDSHGRIDPHGAVDLAAIRRPAFFGDEPWRETIAKFDSRTSAVEVTVPREPYETLRMNLSDPIKLRGWHIAGDGVADGAGGRIKALIVMVSGRNIETTGIHHPDDHACRWSPELSAWLQKSYPNEDARTESGGARTWRSYLAAFADAGFDVLTLDKRGHGISGGASDSNCNEQGADIFRALDSLSTGEGARILTPDGVLFEGSAAAGRLLGAEARDIPVVIAGASQGCMAVCWAMHRNFVGACDFDRPNPRAHGPLGYNVKAALLLAPFAGGLGYRSADDSLVEAARREEFNVQMFPSGEVLGGVASWPALFVGRGLWDFSESLEGSFDSFRRARGPRMIVGVRGPHGEGEWGAPNIAFMQARMVEFAAAALRGRGVEGYVEPKTIRDIVAASPPQWAPTAKPLDDAR